MTFMDVIGRARPLSPADIILHTLVQHLDLIDTPHGVVLAGMVPDSILDDICACLGATEDQEDEDPAEDGDVDEDNTDDEPEDAA